MLLDTIYAPPCPDPKPEAYHRLCSNDILTHTLRPQLPLPFHRHHTPEDNSEYNGASEPEPVRNPHRYHRRLPGALAPPVGPPPLLRRRSRCRVEADPLLPPTQRIRIRTRTRSVVPDRRAPPDRLSGPPRTLRPGFRFKQDLVHLSSTFASQGGFDRVEPFLDITSIYHYLRNPKAGKKCSKETRSLANICEEMLKISLSKELQCSDWSCRPLSEEQVLYAAADAYYLLEIFSIFRRNFVTEGMIIAEKMLSNLTETNTSSTTIGLKEILMESISCDNVLMTKFCKASDMVQSSASRMQIYNAIMPVSQTLCGNVYPLDKCIGDIVREYGEKLLLKEADQKPRASRRKGRRQSTYSKCKEQLECNGVWQGLPPWDPSLGGDGCPKFLCDVMVEGLARHLRCVGIDAAIPSLKKPEPRQLLDQAYNEKRVVLTRDAKLLTHQYLIGNQVYRVKNLLKNDQLLEVIETFQLKISADQLMSRCTKCNGRFIQKPLTMEEAIEASKGFQVIPNCLFNRNTEFWQCTDCHQLYWEGTQYHNAVQKFVTVCKLND